MTIAGRNRPIFLNLFLVSRVLLGMVFMFSGLVKGIDPVGTQIKLGEYFAAVHHFPSSSWLLTLAIGLCLFEFFLGFCLFTAIYRRAISWLVSITMLFMTLLTAYIALYNPVKDCGCFGDAIHLSNTATFLKNLVLLVPCFFVFYSRRSQRIRHSRSERFVTALLAVFLFAYFTWYNASHLPAVDFRPYKIGASIPELKGMAGNSLKQDVYDYKFVYEKDGIEMMFSMDEIEQLDSTWNYVRDASVLISKGEVAPATDFVIMDKNGNDISAQLLAPTSRVMLLFSQNVLKLGEEEAHLFNALSRHAQRSGGSLHLVMSNGWSEEVKEKIASLHPRYPINYLDETTSKTVIRSNPGLLVMEGGTILRKMSAKELRSMLPHEAKKLSVAKSITKIDEEKKLSANTEIRFKNTAFQNEPFAPLTTAEKNKTNVRHWWPIVLILILMIYTAIRNNNQRSLPAPLQEENEDEKE